MNACAGSKIWNIGYTKPADKSTRPFSGNLVMKTYLSYFATGDLHVYMHGRRVRLEATTTHPAQIRLTFDLLGGYCKPMLYSVKNPPYFPEWSQYAWRVVFDLDESFKFLTSLPKRVNHDVLNDDKSFFAALGGFSDAEGFFGLTRRKYTSAAAFGVSNTNFQICDDFLKGLRQRGYSGGVYGLREVGGQTQWALTIASKDVIPMVDQLILRHEEKIEARNLVRRLAGTPWDEAGPKYKAFRREIKLGRNACVLAAKREYANRTKMKQIKVQLEQEITRRAHSLYVAGLRPQNIATLLGRSPRTIYRRVARENDRIQTPRKTPKQADQ
jgi:hypothetical protein